MFLVWIILLPLLGAALSPLAAQRGRGVAAWSAGSASGLALALTLWQALPLTRGSEAHVSWSWIPQLGLNLSLRLDGLALLFVILVLAIGLLVILYAHYYLPKSDRLGRFYALLLLFQTAMLGIVLSDNLLLLLIFWELTSLSSFLLIAYHPHSSEARKGAKTSLIVTAGGGLALMAGLLLLGHIAGSFELSTVLASGDRVRGHDLYLPTLLLILLGAFTKSAQWPLHFWLPKAMAAPTPVSAYLHSATMVKAGVFLLARLFPVLAETEAWFYMVGGIGLATLLFGAYTALFKHDLKGLLAYSTISHLGLITLLFGLGTPLGAVAGLFHLVNHAIFKASLFMAAGIIDHETGTRDMRRINGLWKYMPYTATLAMVAAAAMAGVPLLNGFLSKEMFFAETVHHEWLGALDWLLPTAATLAGVFSVAYSVRFIHDVFFNGEPIDLPRSPREPGHRIRIPVEVLVALCILVGVMPEQMVRGLLDAAVTGVLGEVPYYSLALWHGWSLPMLMSLVALAGGTTVYALRHQLFRIHDRWLPRVSSEELFYRFSRKLLRTARRFMRSFDNGSLQRYLAWLIAVAAILGVVPLTSGIVLHGGVDLMPIDGVSVAAALILAVAAIATVRMRHQRITALIMTSLVGLIVTLTFVHFSAPDLALTQLSVEVVTTILLLLVLYFLPGGERMEISPLRRVRDLLLAGSSGLLIALLAFGVMTRPHAPISDFFLENAKPLGGGSNVVNVILVDFRGFDTLGEITVLAIAAAGIFMLLRGLRLPLPEPGFGKRQWAADVHPLIMAAVSRPLLPLALLVSLFLLLRGHNAPGGGFIAGLVAGTALILQHLASGLHWTQQRMKRSYFTLIGGGVLLASATGLAALLFGRPFLTSAVLHLELPLIGEVELASAMGFDIGVFLTVVGTVILILENLGRLSTQQSAQPPTEPEELR
ncbi:monovalent cation/H+ antiporter subunit A [Thiohalomonas denitrificans]|uniref:Multicomponent K+:H+ antiporter subunit A n=1 Tax=Thiohalomonas denitrificans TaxID=415747 RepID=A0A1G5Q2V8_9GAMM|nr:monovalent cation/H+ antiporter subunit A [Thiohalomonas denitrificans]SCZ56225.1 multicomponent K+:H+ antiporter subunit A [Thiohalomonas denitrificans]